MTKAHIIYRNDHGACVSCKEAWYQFIFIQIYISKIATMINGFIILLPNQAFHIGSWNGERFHVSKETCCFNVSPFHIWLCTVLVWISEQNCFLCLPNVFPPPGSQHSVEKAEEESWEIGKTNINLPKPVCLVISFWLVLIFIRTEWNNSQLFCLTGGDSLICSQ